MKRLCCILMLAFPLDLYGQLLSTQEQATILQQAQSAFDKATELRARSREEAKASYQSAAQKFQQLVDGGTHNGKLFYNLANSYLQLGDIGLAILYYRKAQVYLPNDGRLEANLSYARSIRKDHIDVNSQRALLSALFFWHDRYPISWRYNIALVAFILCWAVLCARHYSRHIPWRYVLLPCLLICLSAGASVVIESVQSSRHPAGVITSDNVIVRKGHGTGYEPQFEQPLNQGVEFVVIEMHEDWMHVELLDGKRGWIRRSQGSLV